MKNEYRVYENWYPVTILPNVMHVFSKKRYGCKQLTVVKLTNFNDDMINLG